VNESGETEEAPLHLDDLELLVVEDGGAGEPHAHAALGTELEVAHGLAHGGDRRLGEEQLVEICARAQRHDAVPGVLGHRAADQRVAPRIG
jgi:hypothetical protein